MNKKSASLPKTVGNIDSVSGFVETPTAMIYTWLYKSDLNFIHVLPILVPLQLGSFLPK